MPTEDGRVRYRMSFAIINFNLTDGESRLKCDNDGKNHDGQVHRLNMEIDLQSLFWLLCTTVLCTHWLRSATSPPPPHSGSDTRALLVSQDRRHLFYFVTPRSGVSRRKTTESGMFFAIINFNLTEGESRKKCDDDRKNQKGVRRRK